MTERQPRSLSYADCKAILEEVRAQSADYSWMWQWCAARQPVDQAFATIRGAVDPARPYFFGQLSNGIRFAGDARDFPAALHALYSACNSTLIEGLISAVGDRGGDIVDIGTNIGVVASSLGRHVGGRGHVHAFEPSPSTFKVAAATIALNELRNITLTEAAIGDEDGEITFHATPGNSAIASAQRHDFPFLNEWMEIVVPCRRIDSFLQLGRFDSVSLIKIDVEGLEMKVLRGAEQTIRAFGPTVVYEYTPVAIATQGWSDHESIAFLKGLRPFAFDALVEPPLHELSIKKGYRVPFPLPAGLQDQVNVFATPGSSESPPLHDVRSAT